MLVDEPTEHRLSSDGYFNVIICRRHKTEKLLSAALNPKNSLTHYVFYKRTDRWLVGDISVLSK